MKKIIHGGDIYSQIGKHDRIIDFSANINPLGIPQKVKEALHNAVDMVESYPDPLCRELTKSLAKKENISEDYFVMGNGAADLIYRFVIAAKPKKALILAPTFSEYELALKTVECEVEYFRLKESTDFSITEEILDCITKEIDVIFICNPNNPTGIIADTKIMIQILDKCKINGSILVVDECFNDFLDDGHSHTLKNELENHKNLFILRAFTKIYAIPGVRLGFGMSSNADLIDKINDVGQAWSVSVFAQEAGIAALSEDNYISETLNYVKNEREYLKKSLRNMGFTVFNSSANYIFFKNNFNVEIKSELEKYGILIRSCDNYVGLSKNYYRIAVKTKGDNEILIETLGKILK
ncbi:MAG: histidinol-phosphate transaminase [Oscillospiraceae bacterium]